MGEGVWIDSEKLGYDDEVGEVLKHGTLSVGFIGLAETLKALLGVHHGESETAQNLSLIHISQISVELLVTLRNKALESYNEIMRINM